MLYKPTDLRTAQEVMLAYELAKAGAGAALIERLTGFGPRWARNVVRESGGELARKPRDPRAGFEADLDRLVHARYLTSAYEAQPAHLPLSKQLLHTYLAYRRALCPALWDLNECAQLIDLYQRGVLWVNSCSQCYVPYLALAQRKHCPTCRLVERIFCRGCGVALGGDHGAKVYCDTCSPRAVRRALRRQARRGELRRAPLERATPAMVTTMRSAMNA